MPDYFTLAELRATEKVLQDATKYPDATLESFRTLTEEEIERATGQAFVPRTRTDTVNVGRGGRLEVFGSPLRSVESATSDGTTVDVTGYRVDGRAGIVLPGFCRYDRVTVTYSYGWDAPPQRIKQAAMLWAKSLAIKGPVDDRTTSFSTADGTFALATPGMRGSTTGIPEVDATIEDYSVQAWSF